MLTITNFHCVRYIKADLSTHLLRRFGSPTFIVYLTMMHPLSDFFHLSLQDLPFFLQLSNIIIISHLLSILDLMN
jgi:hypothetical protein